MTNQSALERPKVRAQVMAWIVEGKRDAEIASLLKASVSRQAVHQFRKRHADELAPVVQQVERQITDYAIAHKVNRIAGLDALAQKIEAWIEERGLMERSEITTDNAVIVRERFAREVPAELRATYRAAAEEMGQLPKSDTTVNIDKAILVRYVEGPA